MKLPTSLRALHYRNFQLYVGGQSISLLGTWMQRIAVSWLVYELTHSALMLGFVAFASRIPMLILSPYAGAYVDRHSRYKTLLFTQVASMVQAGILAFVVLTHHYDITVIILLSIMLGIINAFDAPSRQSLMIVMVQNNKDLPNAIALNSSMVTLARLIGPAVAGILLSTVGEGICFLVNFLSFIAVITSLLLMKIEIPPRAKNNEAIWSNLRQGYIYLKRNPALKYSILLMALISLIVMPYTTLLPVYAKTVFKGDVTTFSWLNCISGLGALMGAIYVARLKPGKNFLKVIISAGLLIAVSLVLFSYTTNLPLALFFIMIGEIGLLTFIASTNTYLQTNVEEHMRGRVISYYVMAFGGMLPIGSLLIGLLAHLTSAPFTILTEGLAGIIVIVSFIPAFKKSTKRAQRKAARLKMNPI
ncbi:MAG: MFS transporter [Bacteroidota bacterium]|nr:MFS transporter [Bacteroidota bacterium]